LVEFLLTIDLSRLQQSEMRCLHADDIGDVSSC